MYSVQLKVCECISVYLQVKTWPVETEQRRQETGCLSHTNLNGWHKRETDLLKKWIIKIHSKGELKWERQEQNRWGGFIHCVLGARKPTESAALMWRRDWKRTFVGEQEGKHKKQRWNHDVCMWSIVFGRVQDQVHKFPWHSQGSALSSVPQPRHSGFRQIDEAVCWNHEASSPAPDTDRRIRTMCGGSGRVRHLSVYVEFRQEWEYDFFLRAQFSLPGPQSVSSQQNACLTLSWHIAVSL